MAARISASAGDLSLCIHMHIYVYIYITGNAISNKLICGATEASKLLHSVGLPVEIPAQVIYFSLYIYVYLY